MNNETAFERVKREFLSDTVAVYLSDREVMEVMWDLVESVLKDLNAELSVGVDFDAEESAIDIKVVAEKIWSDADFDTAMLVRHELRKQGHDCDALNWGLTGSVNDVVKSLS